MNFNKRITLFNYIHIMYIFYDLTSLNATKSFSKPIYICACKAHAMLLDREITLDVSPNMKIFTRERHVFQFSLRHGLNWIFTGVKLYLRNFDRHCNFLIANTEICLGL